MYCPLLSKIEVRMARYGLSSSFSDSTSWDEVESHNQPSRPNKLEEKNYSEVKYYTKEIHTSERKDSKAESGRSAYLSRSGGHYEHRIRQ